MKERTVLFFVVLFLVMSCREKEGKWKPIFNGKDLTGWDTYLGPVYDSIRKVMDTTQVPGLNNDQEKIFSVVNENGQPAIRISGAHNGGISTTDEYKNFHLQLEFKWGKAKWNPRKDRKRDSGLLYHAVGKHGADYGFWMRSQELQIQEGDCGDYWGVAGGVMDIPADGNEREKYVYNPKAAQLKFSATSTPWRRCIKNPDAEKPSGEWNTIDLFCFGDTTVHQVNGKTVMILYHSRQEDNGIETPLKQGKLQLQSEGAEIFYRNLRIQSISGLPKEILYN